MGRSLSWVALVLGLVVCVAVSYAAYTLAGYSWSQVVEYRSPYVAQELPARGVQPAAPLADRVVLVIVDGMRDDITRSAMPNVNRLREYGADITVTTAEPSLSYPNWTTILTGAPQTISGVTTNWWEGPVPAPTIMEVAAASKRKVAVVGPEDFAELYRVKPSPLVSLRPWPEGGYLTDVLVDDALRITETKQPDLLVIHLPDLDEAGHDHGGASPEYREVAGRIDADLGRLITSLQSTDTVFVVTADHGHIAAGGHGGPEPEVVRAPLVVSGAGARLGEQGSGSQDQVAATVSALVGVRPPPFAAGASIRSALSTDNGAFFAAEQEQRIAFLDRRTFVVRGSMLTPEERASVSDAEAALAKAQDERLKGERNGRLPTALGLMGVALLVLLVIGLASWRGLVASLAGVVAYYLAYNLAYFVVHGYRWSLSAFNTEDMLSAFFNMRMLEAALAGVIAVAVAALVYPLLRRIPHGPRELRYLGGWLALAPATILAIQATLALQVAWFLWAYGAQVVWTLPDFKWGFKYDLDLIQATALAAAAFIGLVVSYVVGRYHPRTRSQGAR